MTKARPWMQNVLWLAAAYNILWGAWAVLFPNALFAWAGMKPPLYPELWQCIGMIVGVYGVAYAAAAVDPYRHWPVVMAGLLGKVLGPIGFAGALYRHRFPLAFGTNLLFNDLIWWVPFGFILLGAYRAHIHSRTVTSPEVTRMALRAKTQSGETLEELSRQSPVLLVFLRHAGCTFCREALADLARQRKTIEARNGRLVLVHMGTESDAEPFLGKYGLTDVLRISDPNRSLYRAFGLSRGTLLQLFGPQVWVHSIRAGVLSGHGVGWLAGDGFQMPGVFLIYHGEVIRSFRHHRVSDRPSYASMVSDGDLPAPNFGQ